MRAWEEGDRHAPGPALRHRLEVLGWSRKVFPQTRSRFPDSAWGYRKAAKLFGYKRVAWIRSGRCWHRAC